METLGDKIYNIRKSNGMSQEELAYKIGVSRQTISQWGTNSLQPKIDKISALCELFNVNSDFFLLNDESKITDKETASASEQEVCDNSKNSKYKECSNRLSKNAKLLLGLVTGYTVLIIAVAAILICLFSYPQEGDDTVVSVSFGLTNEGIIAVVAIVAVLLIFINFIIIFRIIKNKKLQKTGKLDKNVK